MRALRIQKITMDVEKNIPAKIYWCKNVNYEKNLGDCITSYIYEKIKGIKPIYCTEKNLDEPVYFGSGSILVSCKNWKNVVVWGTGIMFSNDTFDEPTKTLAVRGPLTRKRYLELGYDCPEVYGDIGLLLPRFYKSKTTKLYKVGVIPHYVDYEFCKKIFSTLNSVKIIDICRDIEDVIDDICECDMTISSSLHGIIVSHAYGIKSCWVKFSEKILGDNSKYFDYYSSLGLSVHKPIIIDYKRMMYNITKLIENYPNPKFPIDTKNLMRVCPF